MKNIELKAHRTLKMDRWAADFLLEHGVMPMAGGAVVNAYVNALTAAGKLDKGVFSSGGQAIVLVQTFATAAADDDGSIYRLFKDISPNLICIRASIYNDAITGGTSWDLGIYDTIAEGGAALVDNVYMSNQDLSSAHAPGAGLNGLGNLAVASVPKMVFENAGHTILTKHRGYDIALTADTVGSGVGNITVVMEFAQG